MTDACSLTPPSSPIGIDEAKYLFQQKEESRSLASIPCFSCKTSTFDPLTSTDIDYFSGGFYKKILEKEILFHDIPLTILLFNKPFSSKTALFTDTKRLFAFTKKNFSILQLTTNPCERSGIRDEELANLRSQICSFLTYVKDFLLKLHFWHLEKQKEYPTPTVSVQLKKFISEFLKELQHLLLFVGRLCDIQDVVLTDDKFVNRNRNSAACYHYYHVCLDVWWSVIEILHITHDLFSSDLGANDSCIMSDNSALAFFNQIVSIVLWDLCFLASKKFKSLNLSMNSPSPFICRCINEFWTQLIVLLDKRHSLYNDKPFWLCLHHIFQQAIQSKASEDGLSASESGFNQFFCIQYKRFINEDLSECFLWLMRHIAHLYKHTEMSNIETSQNTKTCFMISKYLIECILSNECSAKNESRLRSVLATFLLLTEPWEPTGDVLLPLTDFYIKKIDDTFCKSPMNVLGMSYIFNTSVSWLDFIRNVVFEGDKLSMNETSFQIYLRILSVQLTHSGLNSSLWRQLKGRIFSKFTPKRLRDLTEAGLQNCFSVFLTIAWSVSIEEIPLKICDFFLLILNSPENFKKQGIAWKAMFVLLFIMQQKGQTLEKVASNMVKIFNDTCSRYSQSQRDLVKQSNLMNLLMVYVTGMKKLFESSSNLMMSEYLLIGSGFSILLPACANELSHILNIFLDILNKFLYVTEKQDESMLVHETHFILLLQSLFEHVFSFIKDHASSSFAPYQLADLAVNFTNLAIKFSQPMATFTSHTYITVFKYFATAEHVNAYISARYLNLILNDDNYIIKHLKDGISDLHNLLMQGWIKCCVCLVAPDDEATKLTKGVLKQEGIGKVFPGIQQMESTYGQHDFLSIQLFKIMGEDYQNCSSLQEKNHMRELAQLYFSNICIIVSARMVRDRSTAFYGHLYQLMGHLIDYCASLLYIRHDSNCVLPKLIDTLLFPHIMFPKEKFLPALLSNSIKKNLVSFISGILKLDYRNDPYVKRKLKEIIIHYVDNFSLVYNPIMEVCIRSAHFGKHVFATIITILKEHIMAQSSAKSASGFRFLMVLSTRAYAVQREEMYKQLIDDMLMLLLKCEEAAAYPVKDLLNALFRLMKKDTDFVYQKQLLLPTCKKIIQEKLAWSPFKVFRLLEFVGEYFSELFITELIQFITEHIEYIESQRGSGVDAVLRKELKTLTDKLLIAKKIW